jgi:hypothetical protein
VKVRIIFALAATFGALAAASAPGEAKAAGTLLQLGCQKQEATRAFERWGDYRFYKLFPNGGFEQGTTGWRLSGGAQVVAGNEPYGLAGGGGYSLALPAGASATTSAQCVKILESWARFMVLETGATSGVLKVDLQYRGLLGMWSTIRLGSIAGTGQWEPSPAYPFLLENVLGGLLSLNVTTTDVKLKLTASGWGSGFRVDAALVDPWAEGF